MNVYLVEDCENAPGRILAVFAHEEDAESFAIALPQRVEVCERTLFHGQPQVQGFNP